MGYPVPRPVGTSAGRSWYAPTAPAGRRNSLTLLHARGFAFSLGMRVNEKIGMLVSRLSDEVKQGVIRPGADGGVTDIDTAYVADITDLLNGGNPGEYSINLDGFPTGTRMIVRVEYPAAGCQLRVTDVDGRRVTAFITTSPGQPQVLDLRHRARGRCEQRIKDSKDTGLTAVPHHSVAANRVWIHAVTLAGMLSSWARLLGADSEELRKAKQAAHQRHQHGYYPGDKAKEQRKQTRSWWWLWDPGSLRARVLSTAASVAHHARQVRVHFDAHAPHCGLLAAALARIRLLPTPE